MGTETADKLPLRGHPDPVHPDPVHPVSHSFPLIATVAAAFALALGLGVIALRLGIPAIVGYVLAGVLIGPATPGFQGDIEIVRQLAEIGVMLLMFGVGLHLSLEELYAVRRIAPPRGR
jgi:CPA2 family monovalent cation:H+ antiporter-2